MAYDKINFPAEIINIVQFLDALKVIKGNLPLSHLSSDWYWDSQTELYKDYPIYGCVS